MSIPKRHRRVYGTYFVTSRTWESRPLFRKQVACEVFVEALFRYRSQGAYVLHAFVLMPEHFHLLLTPTAASLERCLMYIKGGSARRIRERQNTTLPVWQRGFSDHRIRDTQDYRRHVEYVHQNPVKRGVINAPKDFFWSSASGRHEMDDAPQGLKPLVKRPFVGTAEAVP